MTDDTTSDQEKLVLSSTEAEKLAEACRHKEDPLSPPVPPSLLSAEHIERYIRATGLIAPFYSGGGKNSRLKKASYEGRIGEKAFMYTEVGRLKQIEMTNGMLTVPANSIVFVESDLDFRLPDYIALRFNLQIRHVHRGLLLGTGPLVDPGYWGKLCIPLHNLTDHEYSIPRTEGLIWLEFTRTTSERVVGNPGRIALEKDNKQYWNIEDFITKASHEFTLGAPSVPIRSSIPVMIAQASQRAEDAKNAAQHVSSIFNRIAWIGAVITAITVIGLWASFVGILTPRIDTLSSDVADLKSSAENAQLADQAEAINRVISELNNTNAKVNALQDENRRLRALVAGDR